MRVLYILCLTIFSFSYVQHKRLGNICYLISHQEFIVFLCCFQEGCQERRSNRERRRKSISSYTVCLLLVCSSTKRHWKEERAKVGQRHEEEGEITSKRKQTLFFGSQVKGQTVDCIPESTGKCFASTKKHLSCFFFLQVLYHMYDVYGIRSPLLFLPLSINSPIFILQVLFDVVSKKNESAIRRECSSCVFLCNSFLE